MPEDIAVPLLIDGDKGDLAGRLGALQKLRAVDDLRDQSLANLLTKVIITNRSDHRHRNAEARQGNQGSRDRTATLDKESGELSLLVEGRIMIDLTQDIQRALSQTDDFCCTGLNHTSPRLKPLFSTAPHSGTDQPPKRFCVAFRLAASCNKGDRILFCPLKILRWVCTLSVILRPQTWL